MKFLIVAEWLAEVKLRNQLPVLSQPKQELIQSSMWGFSKENQEWHQVGKGKRDWENLLYEISQGF